MQIQSKLRHDNWRTMMRWRSPLRRFVLFGGAVLWLTGFGVLAQEQSFFTGGAAVSLTAEQASRGKAVYDDNCASCHGANLDNGAVRPAASRLRFQDALVEPIRERAVHLHRDQDAAGCAGRPRLTAPTAMWRLIYFAPTVLLPAALSWLPRGPSPISPSALPIRMRPTNL